MKNLTRKELNEFVKSHTNDDKTYFQAFDANNNIIYGRWLTADDAMDNAGVIDIIQELIKAVDGDGDNVYYQGMLSNDYGEEMAEDNIIILHGINFFLRTIYFGEDDNTYSYEIYDNVDDLIW